MLDIEDSIVAIASPTSPAARGIVRLCGPDTIAILQRLGVASDEIKPRRFDTPIDLGDPLGVVPVNVMVWPTSRSYTGQPSAELHTYGCLPILQSLVMAVTAAGARAARPGEFTMRAFLAGRLDLTQAEAVLGVIEAENRGSLDQALRQLAGNLSRPLEQMRGELLDLLADVEAGLDFVDEDIEFITDGVLAGRLGGIERQLQETRRQMKARSGGGDRTRITLRGEPNAGKSRLLNTLAGQDTAIVADVAGTTRDAVTIDVELDGHRVTLIDTAGIEESTSQVSRLSQQQGKQASAQADLLLWCVDSSRDDFEAACQTIASQQSDDGRLRRSIDIHVATKSDLNLIQRDGWIATSAQSGLGIDELKRTIVAAIDTRICEEVGSVVGTAARCGDALQRAETAIGQAIELTKNGEGHELVAAELRTAVNCLGEVTGAVYTDDLLDRVFGRFCIGK